MPRSQTIEAIYEKGLLRPLEALEGLPEQSKVRITVEREGGNSLLGFAGILKHDEAAELRQIIHDEFERVDLNAW